MTFLKVSPEGADKWLTIYDELRGALFAYFLTIQMTINNILTS